MLNWLLDKSIYFSFDHSGFKRHQKYFRKENYAKNEGKRAIITGGNSGIGYAVAKAFALNGLEVHLICRNAQKSKKAVEQLILQTNNNHIYYHQLDLSEIEEVKSFCKESLPSFDILVNNAGAMPLERTLNSKGNEVIFTSQVLGHFTLTHKLIELNKLKKSSRVIFVSSGGMYLQKLQLDDLNWKKNRYNHYKAYANAKRAQVILNELLAENNIETGIQFSCMHPGWVNTPAIQTYMPNFHHWMKRRLRTIDEGADTIVWLALSQEHLKNGKFWFDRKIAPTHFFPWTRENETERKALWALCKKQLH